MAVQVPTRRQFTVAEYRRMAQAGVLSPDDRVELLEGEIIAMPPIGNRHAVCVVRIDDLFHQLVSGEAVVWVQNPLQLNDRSEPVPDVSILRGPLDRYRGVNPQPPDVMLLVEVSDSSLYYDQNAKLPAYATAGIREVWIVDLVSRQINVYRDPRDGRYHEHKILRGKEALTVQSLPTVTLSADQILG